MQTYEQLTGLLLENLTNANLEVIEIEQEMEQATATKTFTCYCITSTAPEDTKYQAVLSFQWDAIMTYLSVFGSPCAIYHNEKDPCVHNDLQPEVFIDLEIKYLLSEPAENTPMQDLSVLANNYTDIIKPQIRHKNFPDVIFEVGFSEQGHTYVRQAFANHFWHIDLNQEVNFNAKANEVHRILTALGGEKQAAKGRKQRRAS